MKLLDNGIINHNIMLRIISGKFKGRQLLVPEEGTKPITDRIKTSIFDLIKDFLTTDAIVLDLFSGSGNFGLEALSRGVKRTILVDLGNEQAKVINKNIETLKCSSQCTFYKQDVFVFLKKSNEQFDVIMLDPPFPFNFKQKKALLDLSLARLSTDGLLIFRYPSDESYSLENQSTYTEVFKQKYGISLVSFFKKI